MSTTTRIIFSLLASLLSLSSFAQNPKYDAETARRLGADQRGMRSYVLVVLKTGPNKIAVGKERDDMFAGHFANMTRLAAEGKLAAAGPFDGTDGWRGLFIFAVNASRDMVS